MWILSLCRTFSLHHVAPAGKTCILKTHALRSPQFNILPQVRDGTICSVCGGNNKCPEREWMWKVDAFPNGDLRDLRNDQEYLYLFWEASAFNSALVESLRLDHSKPFCVPGDQICGSCHSTSIVFGVSPIWSFIPQISAQTSRCTVEATPSTFP